MDYKQLKEKVKGTGQRVTKDVNGKRMKLTTKELRKKVRRYIFQPSFLKFGEGAEVRN